jgi:tetratricopeptide (TPR) repeat protein
MSSPFAKRALSLALILCLVLVFIPFGVAQEEDEKEAQKLPPEALKALYEAQMLMGEEKWDEAIAILNTYLATRPPDVPAIVYMQIGNCWYYKENFEETRKAFEKAYEIDPSDVKVLANYANITYQTERFVEAAGLWEKLYGMQDPPESKILYQAAAAYYQGEDLKNSKRVLKRMLELPGPAEHKWYELIIDICFQLEEYAEAEGYILEFLEVKPYQSKYWRMLSQIRLDKEELRKGTSDLEIAFQVEAPTKQNQWKNLADLYNYVNAPLMSVRCLKEAYKEAKDAEGFVRMAQAYKSTFRYDEATKILDEGFKKNPSADLLFEKGRVLYDATRFREAIDAFKECVKLDPKRGEAYTLMGFAAWSLMDWDEARTAFADASRLPKFRVQSNSAIDVLDRLIDEREDVKEEK